MYPSMNNMPPKTSFFGNFYNDHSKAPQQFYNTTPTSSSFLLPSPIYINPLLDEEAVFCDFFQDQHNHTTILEHEIPNMEEYSNNINGVVVGDQDDHVEPENSKRVYKGDRHSKINTARGPRDRRMRLSLDVAKKLFGLQDLLGYDKASKTVDWLLTKSKTAILELLPDQQNCSFMGVSNNSSSTSECEVMSGTADDDQFMMVKTTGDDDQLATTINNKAIKSCCKKPKEKVTRVRKCADFHHPLAKASRERARERARERTTEKRNNYKPAGGAPESKFLDQHANRLGSWSTFPENHHQINQVSSNFQFNQGYVCDNSSLLMTDSWSPSYVFNYPHTSGLPHEHQFNELQINEKAWEGSSN